MSETACPGKLFRKIGGRQVPVQFVPVQILVEAGPFQNFPCDGGKGTGIPARFHLRPDLPYPLEQAHRADYGRVLKGGRTISTLTSLSDYDSMGTEMRKPAWFEEGIRFTCTRSGNCCTGDPGAVWLNEEEERAIARRKHISLSAFRARYTTPVEGRPSVVEVPSPRGNRCVFLKEATAGCTVYEARPGQCRTWPFWPENLRTLRAWINAAKDCPGVARGLEGKGKLHSAKEVRALRDGTPVDPKSYKV